MQFAPHNTSNTGTNETPITACQTSSVALRVHWRHLRVKQTKSEGPPSVPEVDVKFCYILDSEKLYKDTVCTS